MTLPLNATARPERAGSFRRKRARDGLPGVLLACTLLQTLLWPDAAAQAKEPALPGSAISFSASSILDPKSGLQCKDMALADLDGDGDLDLMLLLFPRPESWSKPPFKVLADVLVLMNNGAGDFTPAPLSPLTEDIWAVDGLDLADMDADGDADILIWGQDGSWQRRLYRNEGGGRLTRLVLPPEAEGQGRSVVSGWAPRAQPPVFVTRGATDGEVLLFDAATGEVNPVPRRLDAGVHRSVLTASLRDSDWFDYDDDGDLDVSAAPWVMGGSSLRLLSETSPGVLTSVGPEVWTEGAGRYEGGDANWADFDGDGLTDMVVTNRGCPPGGDPEVFLRNVGDGRLEWIKVALGDDPPRRQMNECVVADFDLDGDLDAFFLGNVSTYSYIAENLGNFRFVPRDFRSRSEHGLPYANGNTMTSGDVDGDGDLDLIVGNYARLLRNEVHSHPKAER